MKHSIPIGFLIALIAAAPPARGIEPATASPTTRPVEPEVGPGDHIRHLEVDGRSRSYLVHVPRGYDARKPMPVVLAFHGAFMNAAMMVGFCGLNQKSDSSGFIVVYPNGTGLGEGALFFNAWSKSGASEVVDDVKFTARLLDDLEASANVDPTRVFATGMSNGGMMSHRLAAELSDRIAAVAAVAGTLAIPDCHPKRAVPIMMFHGTADTIVPYNGTPEDAPRFLHFESVDDTVKTWVKADGCPQSPKITHLPDTAHDGTQVVRRVFGPGTGGAEVVLYAVEGGGHTWPGRAMPLKSLGKSTMNISANDLIWEFFLKHPMK